MEKPQTNPPVKTALPNFWVGLFFPAASFLLTLLVFFDPGYKITEEIKILYNEKYGFLNERIDMTPLHSYAPFAALLVIAGWAYWLYCLYRLHQAMAEVTNGDHPISPSRAVWFHLIPIYNLFWVFKWTGEVAKSIHKRSYDVMPEKAAGVLLMLVLFVQYSICIDILYEIPSAREAFRHALAPPLGRSPVPMAILIVFAIIARAAALAVAILVGMNVSRHIRAMWTGWKVRRENA